MSEFRNRSSVQPPPDKTPVWLLTRYEGIATLLRDERLVKEKTTMGLVLPNTETAAPRHRTFQK
jgi:hypothetical protein